MAFDAPQGPGGGDGRPENDPERTALMSAVWFFLAEAERAGDIYQTYRAAEVFDAFTQLMGYDPAHMRRGIQKAIEGEGDG